MGCLPPPEGGRIHLNSTESHRVASGIRSHRQLRDATASKTAAPQDTAARHRTVSRLPQRAAHARTEQDSCRQKGCPTRHASGHHRPPDGSPGRSKAIAQSSLAVAGMERHGPADGRRMAPQQFSCKWRRPRRRRGALSYACEYEGQATQGAAVRSRAQPRGCTRPRTPRPGSWSLLPGERAGRRRVCPRMLRHGRLRRCRAAPGRSRGL